MEASTMNTPASTPAAPSQVFTTVEAADYLKLSKATLNCWRVKGGKGPRFCKMGSAVRYRRADLDAWLESKLISSTSEAA
jgi:excisionase family DNA binding protein